MSHLGKILLIDDDQDTRNIYQELLTEAGYELDFAVNGKEGLTKILEDGYDLILLDIMMPKMDGLQVLKKLKEDQKIAGNNTPIVVLSALDHENVIQEALKLGAKDYLIKSNFSPDEILKKIEEFLKDNKK